MGTEKENFNPDMGVPGKFRVAWKSKITGEEGHGEYIDKKDAAASAEQMNAKYPELEHWIEPEQKPE